MACILVTGASRGIGEAVARELATEHQVLLLARSEAQLEAIGKETGSQWCVADATDADQVRKALVWCRDQCGDVPDVIVNCAGIFSLSPIAEAKVSDLREALEANVVAPFLLMRAFLPGMLDRGAGLFINVGSVSGRKAFPGNGAYSASKFGLRGMHEVLLEELRGTRVRATLIEPGAVDTPLWDPIDPDNQPGLPPRSAMLRPQDVARAIAGVIAQPNHVQIPYLPVERG